MDIKKGTTDIKKKTLRNAGRSDLFILRVRIEIIEYIILNSSKNVARNIVLDKKKRIPIIVRS